MEKKIDNILDACYDSVLHGIMHVSLPVEEFAEEYLKKASSKEEALEKLIRYQVTKCATSGFLAYVPGIATLPVAMPANIASILYVQLRMIAAIAYISGYNVHDDCVQTLVYACLAGVSVNSFVKKAGVTAGTKYAKTLVKKIPGKVLVQINKKIGYRFITKNGTKGVINIAKLVPFVGGVIGGSLDLVETKIIARRAYNMFFLDKCF